MTLDLDDVQTLATALAAAERETTSWTHERVFHTEVAEDLVAAGWRATAGAAADPADDVHELAVAMRAAEHRHTSFQHTIAYFVPAAELLIERGVGRAERISAPVAAYALVSTR